MTSTTTGKWKIDYVNISATSVNIRMGYLQENISRPFKGNILYLEGLSDSMMNHQPFFDALAEAGFRVISFDYMGQGGSDGSMNNTRIISQNESSTINYLANIAWEKYYNPDHQEKMIIGWSTGGLAAYEMAYRKQVGKIVLIAPGLGLKVFMSGRIKTTIDALTSDRFSHQSDPHIDPIKPTSPLLVPLFASHLLKISIQASRWKINSAIKGLVLLSDKQDPYVNPNKTRAIITKNAPHFSIQQFTDSRHEIDNEAPDIRKTMHQNVIDFLSQ